MSIRLKLIIVFLVLIGVTMGVVSVWTYSTAKSALIETTLKGLWATAEFREGEIFLFLEKLKTRVIDFASDGFIRDGLEKINEGKEDVGAVTQSLNMHLIKNKISLDQDLKFIDVVNLDGRVVASTDAARVGMDRSGEQYFLKKIKDFYIGDIYQNRDGSMDQEVSMPLKDRVDPSRTIGYIVNHSKSGILNELLSGNLVIRLGALTQLRGIGQTGETYLVNQDKFMVTDALFVKNAAFRQKVDSYPVRQCLENNEEINGTWVGYYGDRVAGASMCLTVGDFRWVLLSEQSERETFAPIRKLKGISIFIGGLVMLWGALAASIIARIISGPLHKLTEISNEISNGKLDVPMEATLRKDEIGVLSRAFERMIVSLRKSAEDVEKRTQELAQSESKIRAIVESTLEGIIVIDEEGIIDSFNPSAENIFGYKAQEIIRKNISLLIPDVYSESHDGDIKEYWKIGVQKFLGKPLEFTGRRKDGSTFQLEISVNEVHLRDRQMFVASARDITERLKTDHTLRTLSMAVEQSPAAAIITDLEGRIEYVNPKFIQMTGYDLKEAIGRKTTILKSGYIAKKVYEDMWKAITSGQDWQGELYNKKKSGELFWANVSISPIRGREGNITHFVGIEEDISIQKEYEKRLVHEAHFDGLTQLPNRLLAIDRLSQALVRARREKKVIVVMYIDLDQFKMVNDTLGHPVGDDLLVEAARRLVSSVRESDTVARLGGDEFLIIFEELETKNQRQIVTIAQKILGLFSVPFIFDRREAFITASIGITVYPDDGDDSTVLLKNADAAMYKVKGEQRNAFLFFTPEMNKKAIERMEMEHCLRHALENKEMTIHYQPLVDAVSEKLIGAEALLRWNNPVLGAVGPDRFIPLAEETGFIIPLTEWVLETACREAKKWPVRAQSHPLRLSVNISSRSFKGGDFVKTVMCVLKENDFPPDCLELEVTERLLIDDPAKALRIFYELSRKGVRLSVDDFGTGYSALTYLKEFPFHTLKIDRAFVRGIIKEPKDAALAKAIIAISHSLGLKAIGEGVETEEQLQCLRSMGCDLAQGYYFSKPLPAAEFQDFAFRSS